MYIYINNAFSYSLSPQPHVEKIINNKIKQYHSSITHIAQKNKRPTSFDVLTLKIKQTNKKVSVSTHHYHVHNHNRY